MQAFTVDVTGLTAIAGAEPPVSVVGLSVSGEGETCVLGRFVAWASCCVCTLFPWLPMMEQPALSCETERAFVNIICLVSG
jgi:hypothetical protein